MSFDGGGVMSVLGLDISPITQGILSANSIMSTFGPAVSSFLTNPLLGAAQMAMGAAEAIGKVLVEALSAVVGLVKDSVLSVAAFADNMGELAAKSGVSANFLSTFGRAAEDAGGSMEGFADALKFLNKNAAEAANGNADTAQSFRRLGISIRETSGQMKPTQKLFMEMVDAIGALPDVAQQTEAAMSLLGRGGADLLPLIQGGSTSLREMAGLFEDLGAGVDDNLGRAGDKFQTTRTIIDAAWQGVKRTIAEPIMNAVANHFDEIVAVVRKASATIRSVVSNIWEGVSKGMEGFNFQGVFDSIRNLLAAMGLDSKESVDSFSRAIGGTMADSIKLVTNLIRIMADALRDVLQTAKDINNQFSGFPSKVFGQTAIMAIRPMIDAAIATGANDGIGRPQTVGTSVTQNINLEADAQRTGVVVGEAAARAVREVNARRDHAIKAATTQAIHAAAL